jgi:hypothetical protein
VSVFLDTEPAVGRLTGHLLDKGDGGLSDVLSTPFEPVPQEAALTLVQMHRNPAVRDLTTMAGTLDTTDLRVGDDMTVEVALSVMVGAGVAHLLLCDADDERTGSVTWAELAAHRDSYAYTDRIRLRDVVGAPLAAPAPSPFSL